MLSLLRRFANMFNFGNNDSEENTELTVDLQPAVIMPRCSDSSDDPEDKVIEVDPSIILSPGDAKVFSLAFSIDYGVRTYQEIGETTGKYHVDGLTFTLTRFSKKASDDEEYNEASHKPQIVGLPEEYKERYGFHTLYTKFIVSRPTGNMRPGHQYIRILSSYTNKMETRKDIQDTLANLRKLLAIGVNENPDNYSFRFHIEVEKYSLQGTIYEDTETVDVYTKMFKFVFGQGDSYVKTEIVDEENYHIPEDDEDTGQSDEGVDMDESILNRNDKTTNENVENVEDVRKKGKNHAPEETTSNGCAHDDEEASKSVKTKKDCVLLPKEVSVNIITLEKRFREQNESEDEDETNIKNQEICNREGDQ